MAEGRTDPRAVEYALVDGLEDCVPGGTLYAADAVDRMLDALARAGFSVVPADDQLTAEEAEAALAAYIVDPSGDDPRLDFLDSAFAKLRRLAGREDW